MSKQMKLIICFVFIFFGSCVLVSQNNKARDDLLNCKYEIKKIHLKQILLFDHIIFNENDIIDLKQGNYLKLLMGKLSQLKLSRFKLRVNYLLFDLYFAITNTTNSDVVLDLIEGDFYLDQTKIMHIKHNSFLRLKPGQISNEKINIKIPFDEMENIKLKKPKTYTFDGKIRTNIIKGSFTLKSPLIIHKKKTKAIPYKKIERFLNKEKKRLIEKLIKKVLNYIKQKLIK